MIKPSCQARVRKERVGADPFFGAAAEAASALNPGRAAAPQHPQPGWCRRDSAGDLLSKDPRPAMLAAATSRGAIAPQPGHAQGSA